MDSGRFAYDGKLAPYREKYGSKTPGHNVIMLDGCGQSRGVQVAKAPVAAGSWGLSDEMDFAFGSTGFDAEYMKATAKGAKHTRGLTPPAWYTSVVVRRSGWWSTGWKKPLEQLRQRSGTHTRTHIRDKQILDHGRVPKDGIVSLVQP